MTVFVSGTVVTKEWLNAVDVSLYGPEHYGALGDGTTDDTTAFLTIAALNIPIILGDKTYVISPAAWPTSVRLIGSGKSIIKWKAASAETDLFALSGLVDFYAEGITFDGNKDNQTDSTGYYGIIGGTLSNGSKVRLESCSFINGRISDIYLVGPTVSGEYANLDINYCYFYNGLVGTSTRAAQAVAAVEGIKLKVTNTRFKQPSAPGSYGRGGVVMQRTTGSTATSWGTYEAHGNIFENFGRGTSAILGCLYCYSGADQVTISGNQFTNAIGTAITAKADCSNIAITGNTVNGHTSSISAAIAFFDQATSYTSSLGRNLNISNNVIYTTGLEGIFVDGARTALSDFENVMVTGNVVMGPSRGFHFRNVNTMRFTGNTIKNTTGSAIFGEDCGDDIVVSENTISGGLVGLDINGSTSTARISLRGNKLSSLTGHGLRLRSAVESFNITGNEISGCTTAIQTVGATNPSSIKNNYIYGETTTWDKSGTYGILEYKDNMASQGLTYTQRLQTIASDAVTVFSDFHWLDTEGAAASDNLATINGGFDGRRVILQSADSSRDITIKDGTGNILSNGDFTLSHPQDTMELIYRSGFWYELGRSDNAA